MNVNTALDTDISSLSNSVERSFNKFIDVNENRSQISSSSNISVITTTSTSSYSQTNEPVYITLSKDSKEYQLVNSKTGNFRNGATDNFLDITGNTPISQFDKLQLRLKGTDDWRVKSLIILMNDDVVYYGENINRVIGDDGGEIWTDSNITDSTFSNGEIDENDEAVNSIDIITLTSGVTYANTDSSVYFNSCLNDGSYIYSGAGVFLGTTANDLEKNQSDRFHITGNKNCKIGQLKSFKLTIDGNDGWKIQGIIVIINNKKVVYCDMDINTWIDGDSSTNKTYIAKDFDVFLDPVENRKNTSSYSNIDVFTTTPAGSYMGTNNPVYITLSENSGEFELVNSITGNFVQDSTDNFLNVTKNTAISQFDKLTLRVDGTDDWRLGSLIIVMDNKLVYYRDNINQGIGDNGVEVWEDNLGITKK